MKIRFVTSNQGKIAEASAKLAPLGYDVVGVPRELEEIQADTIESVARHKAQQLVGVLSPPFFIEDAGLHVEALSGFPGAYSSYVFRTIGCDGILRLTGPASDEKRRAHFLAVIAYVDPSERIHMFQGRVDGRIAPKARGTNGFGFDPIFIPDGETRTFAEMSVAEKADRSHRGRALELLATHLATTQRRIAGKKP